MSDIGFALNYQYITEVDITPGAEAPTWAWVGPGIKSIAPEVEETTDDASYYSDGGNASSDVTGISRGYTVEGDRRFGDAFQDYVASIEDAIGEGRKTQYRITDPAGKVIQAPCTIKDINASGPNGDANSKQAFSCTLVRNGLAMVIAEAKGNQLPEGVTASTVTVTKAGQTTQAKPSVTPETASQRCLYAVDNPAVATVDADGNVKGVKQGKCKLAIRCAAKPSVATVVDVTVSA